MSENHLRKSRHIEIWVEDQFIERGYVLHAANKRVAGVEIDRVFKNQEGDTVLCEIKSVSDWDWLGSRVHETQKRRLRRAQALMASWEPRTSVLLYLCFFHVWNLELQVYDDLGEFIFGVQSNWTSPD
jgi:hypothetical protein